MPQPPAEVTLTAADVDRLLASQHPALRGELRAVASGWDNEVFRLGDDLAVRLPRREAAAHLVENEQRWLPILAPALPVRVPVPVAVGVPDDDYPWRWSIVPWFDGVRVADLPLAERDALAGEVAAALRALHVVAPPDAPRNPVRGVPLRERDGVVRGRLAGSPGLVALWDAGLAAPEWSRPDVWVHGDVHPGNLIARGGRLEAVIDFGDMCAGDPACDLAVAWTAFGPAGRARLRADLGDGYDDAMWARARAWAVAFATLLRDADDAWLRALSAHAIAQLLGE
ncbi:aminoglycoside phosphotransferase family protein [Microbacterium sp. PA5]|uniref:aminoglycoside phosphotransferase family protein n=1 Tax=Microbacterium sp. PA5 TaxID=3416654 RepID=UPI003CF5EAF5